MSEDSFIFFHFLHNVKTKQRVQTGKGFIIQKFFVARKGQIWVEKEHFEYTFKIQLV